MRLDKYLSQSTGFSRKEIKRLLRAGEVTVNGEAERDASRHLLDDDEVVLGDYDVEAPYTRYLMLNKPEGYVCANTDATYPTVVSLVDLPRAEELNIAGRLDVDTTGLVLLTDDGKWAHRITSPNHKTDKVYHVFTRDLMDESYIKAFANGIKLNSERFPTKPAEIELLAGDEARVIIHEGRYHQVKRMFAALGNEVVELHRESIGPIKLDDDLLPGEYRELTPEEVALI